MSLIIEDGSVVPGAESYATAAELQDYAEKFGRTIPGDEDQQESLLRRAALEMERMPWVGRIVSSTQDLAWPRYDVYVNCFLLPSNAIPSKLKAGQMALATEIHADDVTDPAGKVGPATRKKVGPLEFEYAAPSASVSRPAASRQSYAQFAGLVQASGQVRMVRG